MAWTNEQQQAIEKDGSNILISAGAGSGKTAVLTERVLNKIKHHIHIDELLILTFTNAAASEMKNRIKQKLVDNNETEELKLLDASYITTFDSYALSIVKKYHYLLNIPKDIDITDESVIVLEKRKIINDILATYYEDGNNESFNEWININTVKDDKMLVDDLLRIINKIEIKSDIEQYLNTYIDEYYNEKRIQSYIDEYHQILMTELDNLRIEIEDFESYFIPDYYSKLVDMIHSLIDEKDLDQLISKIKISKLPTLPRGTEDEVKNIKEKCNESLKGIKGYCSYGLTNDIKQDIITTKKYMEIIIDILKKYFTQMTQYKKENLVFDFSDISHLAYQIIKDNPIIRNQIKDSFKEIMVDEYQDTSDIQDDFIELIANHNIYMVGDVKQSIYRFRNANPDLFSERYDTYSKGMDGIKIDLLKNFRSREEVLNNINTIFNPIMDKEIGNAAYIESHQMSFGNTAYNEYGKSDIDHNMEIFTYPLSKEYNKEEIEFFFIAQDIQKKIKEGYLVYNNKNKQLEKCTYQDFTILMDRNSSFDTAKRIFEYFHIPLSLYKDEDINNYIDINMIKNLMNICIHMKQKKYDVDFEYSYTSIARSYLYQIKDNEIYETIHNKTYSSSPIIKDLETVVANLHNDSIKDIISNILVSTHFYEKIITYGNVIDTTSRIEKIMALTDNLKNMHYDIYDFMNYLNELLDMEEPIKFNNGITFLNAVKMMNIHKSKGLEFPIIYYCGLSKKFNRQDLKGSILYESDYPMATPIFNEGVKDAILRLLIQNNHNHNDISEKIRLLYVGLTRAKEKMIFILPEKDSLEHKNKEGLIINSIRYHYQSFADILYSIPNELKPYQKELKIETLGLSKNYLLKSIVNEDTNNTSKLLTFSELNIPTELITEQSYAKKDNQVIDIETRKNMDFGTKIHERLEYTDFKNYQPMNTPYDSYIKALMKQPVMKNVKDAEIYHEYEFIYEKDNQEYHGIMDLMMVNKEDITIIDYKLNHIDDEHYIDQLHGYKDYLKTKTNKPIHTYLYSILNNEIKEVN